MVTILVCLWERGTVTHLVFPFSFGLLGGGVACLLLISSIDEEPSILSCPLTAALLEKGAGKGGGGEEGRGGKMGEGGGGKRREDGGGRGREGEGGRGREGEEGRESYADMAVPKQTMNKTLFFSISNGSNGHTHPPAVILLPGR